MMGDEEIVGGKSNSRKLSWIDPKLHLYITTCLSLLKLLHFWCVLPPVKWWCKNILKRPIGKKKNKKNFANYVKFHMSSTPSSFLGTLGRNIENYVYMHLKENMAKPSIPSKVDFPLLTWDWSNSKHIFILTRNIIVNYLVPQLAQ